MVTVRKTIRLHPKQAEFRRDTSLYRGFVGGRGAGKSWVGAYDLIRRLRPGRAYLIGSPTGVLMQDTTFPTFKELAQDLGIWAGVKLTPYPTATVLLEGGTAEVRFRTADDPERMRGPNLAGAWLDEASLMHADVRRIVYGSLRSRGDLGWLSATFTPHGQTHWTYEAFAAGLPNTSLVRAKTRENVFNHADFERTLREQYGETLYARQELDGEFVGLEGAEFPAQWFGDDLMFDAWPRTGIRVVVQSLDPSKGSDGSRSSKKDPDYQAHVTVAAAVEGQRWVYYVDADLKREGVVPMCERAVQLAKLFHLDLGRGVDSVIVEDNATMGLLPAAFDPACVKYQYPIPYMCRPSVGEKEWRIRSQCAPPLSRRQMRFRRTPGGRMLLGQLQSFPKDEFDDGPDALATALKRVAELLSGAA